jgi:hypothetical protein
MLFHSTPNITTNARPAIGIASTDALRNVSSYYTDIDLRDQLVLICIQQVVLLYCVAYWIKHCPTK